MKIFLLPLLSLISFSAFAQNTIVSQDFSSSSVVNDYVSNTPSSGQFNAITPNPFLFLPEPDNENRVDGAVGISSIDIVSGKLQMDLKSAWCIYRTNNGYYSLNTIRSSGSIARDLEPSSAVIVQYDFSKNRTNGLYLPSLGTYISKLHAGPFQFLLGAQGNTFNYGEYTFTGEHKISIVYNDNDMAINFNLDGEKSAEAKKVSLYVDGNFLDSQTFIMPSQIYIGGSSDYYLFTNEPYYAPGNPEMSQVTLFFDNISIKNISPSSNAFGPAAYLYIMGNIFAVSTTNQRYVYTKEVDSPTSPGQKETVKIYFDGTQWVWELAPSVPSGRTTATILATNPSLSSPNAPCSGWTNDFGLAGGGCNNSPLPVTLSQFTVVPSENNSTLLQWTTTSETNSDHFELEHSGDAIHWQRIGKVASKGESSQLVNYSYTHTNPTSGVNYYRLKQTDKDGTFAYSRIVSVNFSNVEGKSILYPNPVSDRFFISELNNITRVQILNLTGQIVLEADDKLHKGIPLQGLASGMYLVKILDANGVSTIGKIIVQK